MTSTHIIARPTIASSPDLPLQSSFLVAGSVWRVCSNSHEVLNAVQQVFAPGTLGKTDHDLSVSFFVDPQRQGESPWPQPYYRGLDHLVYASYGPGGSMLIDFARRRVIGSFSVAMARDSAHWKRVLLPVLLGIISAPIGITPLHSACVVKGEDGLIIVGASGAGKSTLAVSLSLRGFEYLSDDWTYLSRDGEDVHAWGLPNQIKLLPDAVRFFPQLENRTPGVSLNGELAVEGDPIEIFGVRRSLWCRPRWLVFLERNEEKRAVFQRVESADAASRCASLLETLPASMSALLDVQMETIRALVRRECWLLRHGLQVEEVTQRLVEFCSV